MTEETLTARRHPAGVLHGRRAGRPLRPAQRARLDRLLPAVEVGLDDMEQPQRLFASSPEALRLEIGFGAGEHLVDEAGRSPGTGFIGCEPFRNGVAKLVEQIEALGLDNVRVYAGDAGEVVETLPAGSLARVEILYPDPWPKRRQRKRRFLTDERLRGLGRILRPGGELHFATDIDDYAGWVLARVLRSPDFVWDATSATDWTMPWPEWRSTRYERKAVESGRQPVYLTFRRR